MLLIIIINMLILKDLAVPTVYILIVTESRKPRDHVPLYPFVRRVKGKPNYSGGTRADKEHFTSTKMYLLMNVNEKKRFRISRTTHTLCLTLYACISLDCSLFFIQMPTLFSV